MLCAVKEGEARTSAMRSKGRRRAADSQVVASSQVKEKFTHTFKLQTNSKILQSLTVIFLKKNLSSSSQERRQVEGKLFGKRERELFFIVYKTRSK